MKEFFSRHPRREGLPHGRMHRALVTMSHRDSKLNQFARLIVERTALLVACPRESDEGLPNLREFVLDVSDLLWNTVAHVA